MKHLDMAIIMGGPADLVQVFLAQIEPAIVATSRAAAPADQVPHNKLPRLAFHVSLIRVWCVCVCVCGVWCVVCGVCGVVCRTRRTRS